MELFNKVKSWIYRRVISPDAFATRERAFWKNRKSDESANPFLEYWNGRNSSPNRQKLAELIIREVDRQDSSTVPVIMEFGAFCGPNLAVTAQKIGRDTRFYAVEPNGEACAFLKSRLPTVSVLEMDDVKFCEMSPFEPRINVAFVNAVFYVMPEASVRRVLQKFSQLADVIVIGDEMKNSSGKASHLDRKTLSFQHPYRTMLSELGFTIFAEIPAPEPVRALDGFLVARRATTN